MKEKTLHTPTESEEFTRFLSIIRKLRDPKGGCPWDLEQTFESLAPQLIEESYEVIDAAAEGSTNVAEELGDLLSVIGLYTQIAEDTHAFSYRDVFKGINDKLVRRHPHVFGNLSVSGTDEVVKNWEAIKQSEKQSSSSKAQQGVLSGIPRSLPALLKAYRIGEKCARVGFDWEDRSGVADKVREEVNEFLEVAHDSSKRSEAIEEFGDLLFSLAQLGRHLGIHPEEALQAGCKKFEERFAKVEGLAATQFPGKELRELGMEELEELWERVKRG